MQGLGAGKKDQLMKELEELQASFDIQKKKFEELRVRFATKKEELNENYHKQVDEMFFFGYQCCMRKNGITHDIPSYPFDEKDVAISGPAHEDKDSMLLGPSKGSDCTFALSSFFHLVLSRFQLCNDTFSLSIHARFTLLVYSC